jgi:glycine cleavage system H protein
MNIKENYKYTDDHEWLKIEGDLAWVGVSDHAQGELGDIVFIEVPTVGESLDKGESFGTIEAVKTVADMYMPVAGEVLEFNAALESNPELVNQEPYEGGWIAKIRMSNPAEADELMDAVAYKAYLGH